MWPGLEVAGAVWGPGSGVGRCREIQGPSPVGVEKGGELARSPGPPSPPSAPHRTGDPEDRRRVLDTSGGSRVCSGLAADGRKCEGHQSSLSSPQTRPSPPKKPTPLSGSEPMSLIPPHLATPPQLSLNPPLKSSPSAPTGSPLPHWAPALPSGNPVLALPVLPAVSSCVRQGLAVGLAVAGAKVGGLGFRPLGDGVGDLPLGRIPWGTGKWGPKGGSRYPEGRRSMGKGAGPGPGCGVDGKAVGAGNVDTPGAGGTVEKGNLGEK